MKNICKNTQVKSLHTIFAELKKNRLVSGLNALSGFLAVDPTHPQKQKESIATLLRVCSEQLGVGIGDSEQQLFRDLGEMCESRACNVAFYNLDHYRTVIINYTALMLASGTIDSFSAEQRFMGLIASAIHDLGHDGGGNGDTPFRLEDQSFRIASFVLASYFGSADTAKIQGLLRATDCSGNPSPAQRVREGTFDDGLDVFKTDPDLKRLAIFVQAADILQSAALDVQSSRNTSARIETETHGAVPANAQSFEWFLNNIALPAFQQIGSPGLSYVLTARAVAIRDALKVDP